MVEPSKEEIYARHEIGAKVGFGKRPAVLVVDLQKGYTSKESPRWGGTRIDLVVGATKKLVEEARGKGIRIIFAIISFRKDSLDCGVWGEKSPGVKMLTEGSKWVELDDAFQLANDDMLLVKKRSSAFFGTNLLQILVTMNIDTLIVAGCNTSGCIRATVTDACCLGYRTVVPEECVGDRAEEPHRNNLFDINAKYADVMPLTDVLTFIRSLEDQSDMELAPQRSASARPQL